MKYYAVFKGRKPGVYNSWSECQAQVNKFPGCKFKSFSTETEASKFAKFGNLNDNVAIETKPTQPLKRKLVESKEIPNKRHKSPIVDYKLILHSNGEKYVNDSNGNPVVYTDGACSSNGKSGSNAGFGVWWGDNHSMNHSQKLHGIQTNQRAEIAAIDHAIKQAIKMKLEKLTIRTDSKFVINCVCVWSKNWVKNGWVSKSGAPVVHKKELTVILENLKKINVSWEHVRGHRGIYGNEMADKLAVAGISK